MNYSARLSYLLEYLNEIPDDLWTITYLAGLESNGLSKNLLVKLITNELIRISLGLEVDPYAHTFSKVIGGS